MSDVAHVFPQTFTNLMIRPDQYTDEFGTTHVGFQIEVGVDAVIEGRGSGSSLGAALVAAGLDMMGVEADLLAFTLGLVKSQPIAGLYANESTEAE